MEDIKKGIIIECEECFEVIAINDDTENKDILIEKNICSDCLEANYTLCHECMEYHLDSDMEEVEFLNEYKKVCTECVEWHDDKYYYCEDCGGYKYAPDYECTEVYDVDNNYEKYICESCKDHNSNIFWCDYHERWEDAYSQFDVNNYGTICINAYESGEFGSCDTCGEIFELCDMNYTDYASYCNSCYEDIEDKGQIKSYHDHKCDYHRNTKILNSDDNVLTYGFELEVEAGNKTTCGEMSNILYESMDNFTVYESDGSLNEGFEIISNPYDLEYYDAEGKDLIINMLNLLIENKFKSHDTSTCGLHVHIGRHGLGNSYGERDKTIMQIGFIVEYFKEELTTLSRRKPEKLNHWAKFTTKDYKKEELTLDIINKLNRENRSRYSALNLQNEATIELRLFRGTLKKETFLATLELVHNICVYAKENNINDLEALDFYNIATYEKNEYIGNYLELKGIKNKVVC